jgi:hypothetical protein
MKYSNLLLLIFFVFGSATAFSQTDTVQSKKEIRQQKKEETIRAGKC